MSVQLVRDLPQEQVDLLKSLNDDISVLYKTLSQSYMQSWKGDAPNEDECPETVSTVRKACQELSLINVARFYHVESDYYSWPLQQRAYRLQAPSQAHLCKSVIMENTVYNASAAAKAGELSYPKYICVITQYIAPVNTAKLTEYLRSLSGGAVSKRHYNYRLAKTETSLELTGFHKGGVSPVGMRTTIPIFLAKDITELEPPVMYVGAGHIDWKLALPVEAFIAATECKIVDLTQ